MKRIIFLFVIGIMSLTMISCQKTYKNHAFLVTTTPGSTVYTVFGDRVTSETKIQFKDLGNIKTCDIDS